MNTTVVDDPMFSMLDPTFTFQFDKYSCMVSAYHAHVTLSWLIFFSGIFCFLSRVVPGTQWTHVWFGRLYIHFMLWCTATSLLIHNTGLPTGVIMSFLWVLLGLSFGWIAINIHQHQMQKAACMKVGEAMQQGKLEGAADLAAAIAQEKGRIAADKTFLQRMLSFKALHGCLMFTSWINIAGRIFATPRYEGFSCHTYPYYKQIDTRDFQGAGKPLTPVELHHPRFQQTPWGRMGVRAWSVALSIGPLAGSFVVGSCIAAVAVHRRRRYGTKDENTEKDETVVQVR